MLGALAVVLHGIPWARRLAVDLDFTFCRQQSSASSVHRAVCSEGRSSAFLHELTVLAQRAQLQRYLLCRAGSVVFTPLSRHVCDGIVVWIGSSCCYRVGGLRRDVRLAGVKSMHSPIGASGSCLPAPLDLVEAFGVGVASDAIDPMGHATKVAADCALSTTFGQKHTDTSLGRRLQSMHEDPCQEARGAEMRTSGTVPSQRVVLETAGNPVEEVRHASNYV